jgi:hypothetical protein
MPLLSETFASILQTNKAVALAAAVVIGTHHGDVLQWVWDMLGPHEPRRRRKRRKTKANGASGKDPYLDRRRAQRDADDQALVEAIRADCDHWGLVGGDQQEQDLDRYCASPLEGRGAGGVHRGAVAPNLAGSAAGAAGEMDAWLERGGAPRACDGLITASLSSDLTFRDAAQELSGQNLVNKQGWPNKT